MSSKFRQNNIAQSVFEKNYNQISEQKKEILNQKYNCSICLEIIKHENPYLCYECQKIFHQSCLKYWDERQKQIHKQLSCPNCRNELSLEKWKVFRNYDEIRTKDAEILNQIGKNYNSNEYIDKSINLFKFILDKLKIIHPMVESQKSYKLNNLIQEIKSNLNYPSIDEVSTVIIEELDLVEEYIRNAKKGIIKEEIKYKNEITIKYFTEEEGNTQIFRDSFVENNINNISLIINGKKSELIEKYYLKKGENNVTMCIKNPLTDLSLMFFFCKSLYNIDELKYLNTENVTDFSHMFGYSNISNISALENWDTSKSESFKSMFADCELLTNIKPLKNWNVSNCKNFSFMFYSSKKISDISSLENWNVSNGTNFECMFYFNSISNIKSLEKWDVSNANNLNSIFYYCQNLSNISPLKNWNISKVTNLQGLFDGCIKLSDISPLKNWNVSNCQDLGSLFSGCESILDIAPLKNWDVSNVKDFSYLLNGCFLINDLKPLENWDVSKGNNFNSMFGSCDFSDLNPLKNWNVSNGNDFCFMFASNPSLSDLKPLEKWNVSNCVDFSGMFYKLVLLKDISPLKNWNFLNGKKFKNMFACCESLKNRDVIKKWKFPKNTDFQSMFLNN